MWLLKDNTFDSVIFNSIWVFFASPFRLKNGPKLAPWIMTFLILEMTSNVVDSDTVESAVLNNPYIDPEIVSLALL